MPGTYILQWRNPEFVTAASAHPSSFDFSLPMTQKCKIMYYYEVLDSVEYRYGIWNFCEIFNGLRVEGNGGDFVRNFEEKMSKFCLEFEKNENF